MLNDIFSGWEKDFLFAVPFSVAMNSHLGLTIAQIRMVSNTIFAVHSIQFNGIGELRQTLWNCPRVHIVMTIIGEKIYARL